VPFLDRVGRRLLFLKWVENIEVYVWEAGESSPRRLVKAHILPGGLRMDRIRECRRGVVDRLKELLEHQRACEMDRRLKQVEQGIRKVDPDPVYAAQDLKVSNNEAYYEAIQHCSLHDELPSCLFSLRVRTITEAHKIDGRTWPASLVEGAWVISTAMGLKEDYEWAASRDCQNTFLALLPYAATAALVALRESVETPSGAAAWPSSEGDLEVLMGPWTTPAPYPTKDDGSETPVPQPDGSARLYASLPTPVKTGLPRHVQLDGRFEMNPDRNSLRVNTSGGQSADKRTADYLRSEWNVRLARGVAVSAYARMVRAVISIARASGIGRQQIPPDFLALPLGKNCPTGGYGSVAMNLLPHPNISEGDPLFKDMVRLVYQAFCDPCHVVWARFSKSDPSIAPEGLAVQPICLRSLKDQTVWSSIAQTLYPPTPADLQNFGAPGEEIYTVLAACGYPVTDAPLHTKPGFNRACTYGSLSPRAVRAVLHKEAASAKSYLQSLSPNARALASREILSYVLSDITIKKEGESGVDCGGKDKELQGLPLILRDAESWHDCAIEGIGERSIMLNLEQMNNGDLVSGRGEDLLLGKGVRAYFIEDRDLTSTPEGKAQPAFASQKHSLARQLWPLWKALNRVEPFGAVFAVEQMLPAEWRGRAKVEWPYSHRITREWVTNIWKCIDAAVVSLTDESGPLHDWPLVPCCDELVAISRASTVMQIPNDVSTAATATADAAAAAADAAAASEDADRGNASTPLARMDSGQHTALDSAIVLLTSVGVPVADPDFAPRSLQATQKPQPLTAIGIINALTALGDPSSWKNNIDTDGAKALLELIARDHSSLSSSDLQRLASLPLFCYDDNTHEVLADVRQGRYTRPSYDSEAHMGGISLGGTFLNPPDTSCLGLYTKLHIRTMPRTDFFVDYVFTPVQKWQQMADDARLGLLNEVKHNYNSLCLDLVRPARLT